MPMMFPNIRPAPPKGARINSCAREARKAQPMNESIITKYFPQLPLILALDSLMH